MGHINFDKGNKKKSAFNGFYLALAICLVAVGGVAVTTFISAMRGVETDKKGKSENPAVATTNPTKPVGQVVTNIPDDRTSTPKSTATSVSTSTTAARADLFILPLTNQVIRAYSNSKPVFSPTMNDWRVHNGVDFAGSTNQTVKALADGTIASISKDTIWGDVVLIDHGYGIQSRYCGVNTSLKKGAKVKVGDEIGKITVIPCETSDPPHLHLEIMVNNEYVNPIEAIGREVKYSAQTTSSGTTKK
ncbi:MAG: M23 family metallopeptidase [Clostridiales bacterium]|nr:M23 family metallopeptidase [Clostridiales bacterium]